MLTAPMPSSSARLSILIVMVAAIAVSPLNRN
jgi:hypothetical protein